MTEYTHPTSIDETLRVLGEADGKARVIAGGTDVMPEIRDGKIAPDLLVDITRVPGMKSITLTDETITVGSAVTFAEIKTHPGLTGRLQALQDAARSVGAGAIQGAATWVGNLVQAMPAADGAIIALALDGEVHVCDREGQRWLPVDDLFLGPGQSAVDPTRQLITCLRFPVHTRNGRWGTAWRRVGRREALVLPILNCAVKIHIQDENGAGRISRARLAIGPAGPIPFRARRTEVFLLGKPPSRELWIEAGKMVQEESHPRSSVMRASRSYRMEIIPPLVEETLQTALERAQK